VLIVACNKDVAYQLLDKYEFEYRGIGNFNGSLMKKAISLPWLDFKMYLELKKFNPDIILGFGSIIGSHASFLRQKKCINFEDTETSMGQIRLYLPFTDTVCTPSCFLKDLGPKQIRYNGYTGLTHLHPNYYKPDPSVLDELDLNKEDEFIILRFVSWTATHDLGHSGIKNRLDLIKELENYGRVFISSESELNKDYEKYKIRSSPEKLHDLLYYSSLYIGEGGTTASEAAILGTHSIFISTASGQYGVFRDLERYGLLWTYDNEKNVAKKVGEILQNNPKIEGKRKRDVLLKDKIDVTAFMCQLIENYPDNVADLRDHNHVKGSKL
jgi:hypothetical protein